ncbi:DgyrCDS2744 [Dimorphilus gyrociliatus]|uniref:DgyrCDS2744 n=1 Tax=Dimorphilus gyrociliatus TaxID=2664684 RepID=A0A7I8VDX8_9ANNE|nr:DgyrCDS2744 [Dimorphilus gyrociliatus]
MIMSLIYRLLYEPNLAVIFHSVLFLERRTIDFNNVGWHMNDKKLHDAHPFIGIVVLILVLINPIMAIFRPAPTHSKRPIFNWCHRIVGLSALILGIINIVIGLRLDRVALESWVSWVAVGFFFFIIFVGLILDFVPLCVSDAEIKKSNTYALQPAGQSNNEEKKSHFAVKFVKSCAQVLIVLASLTATIIIVVQVADK